MCSLRSSPHVCVRSKGILLNFESKSYRRSRTRPSIPTPVPRIRQILQDPVNAASGASTFNLRVIGLTRSEQERENEAPAERDFPASLTPLYLSTYITLCQTDRPLSCPQVQCSLFLRQDSLGRSLVLPFLLKVTPKRRREASKLNRQTKISRMTLP